MILRRATTLFIALSVVACSDSTGPLSETRPTSPSLQTDRLEYVLSEIGTGWETELAVTYQNRTGQTVYFPGCSPEREVEPLYDFVRAEPDTGRVAHTLRLLCVESVPALPMVPGGTRVDTVLFVSFDFPDIDPPFQPHERVGLMRVIYAIFGSTTEQGEADWRDPLPIEDRRSNVFRVRFEDDP